MKYILYISIQQGDTEQAATLMLMTGETDKALEYAKDGLHKDLIGQIHLVLAFKYETQEHFDIVSYFCLYWNLVHF